MDTRFVWGVKDMYENQIMVMVTQFCKCAKNHRMGHFKWVNCTVCKLDVNKAIFKISYMGQMLIPEKFTC